MITVDTTMHYIPGQVETGPQVSADAAWAAAVDVVLADQAAAAVSELIETTLLATLADYGRLVLDTEPDEAGLDALADMLSVGLIRPQELVVPGPAVQLLTGATAWIGQDIETEDDQDGYEAEDHHLVVAPTGEDRPPLPTRPPNPGRHDRAPGEPGPALPHPHAVPVGEDERPPLPVRVPGSTNPPPPPAPSTVRVTPETAPWAASLCHCGNAVDGPVCIVCGCSEGSNAQCDR